MATFKSCKQENGQIHQVKNVSELSSQRLYSRADAMHNYNYNYNYTQTRHLAHRAILVLKDLNCVQFQRIFIPIPWSKGWSWGWGQPMKSFMGEGGYDYFSGTPQQETARVDFAWQGSVLHFTKTRCKSRCGKSKGWFPLAHKMLTMSAHC